MKLKQNKSKAWKPKSKSTFRDRKRRKQYKQLINNYQKPYDYMNQHLKLSEFKKFKCTRSDAHDHKTCFDYHGEEDRIRSNPGNASVSKKCKDGCGSNRKCSTEQNDYEKWFHPSRYKKVFCKSLFEYSKDGKLQCSSDAKCPLKDYCPFAHNEEEIRTELLFNYEIDDDFMMFRFKTETCPLMCIDHDHEKCVYSHSPKDHRRMVIFQAYRPRLSSNVFIKDEEERRELIKVNQKLIKMDHIYEQDIIQIFKENLQILENKEKFKNAEKTEKQMNRCEDHLECKDCQNALEFLYHPSIYKSIHCFKTSTSPCNKQSNCFHKNEEKTPNSDFFSDSLKSNNSNISESSETSSCQSEENHTCHRTHCPYSHEPKNLETLQECTEAPFYKFAYNRIKPGTFFAGNSFFSNRSENLVYPEDRAASPSPPPPFGIRQNNSQQFMPNNMDPQKMYFNNQQNQWGNYMSPNKKENYNYMNFASPVNMNMFRIQMNNTFLMPHQQMGNNGYFGYGNNGQRQYGNGYQQGFYRC